MHHNTYTSKYRLYRTVAVLLALMLFLLSGCATTPEVADEPITPVGGQEDPAPDLGGDSTQDSPTTDETPEPDVVPEPVPDPVDPVDPVNPPEVPPASEETSQEEEDAALIAIPLRDITAPYCVVIDAGHGGFDPGAVIDDVYEKDIDLAVALKIQSILSQHDVEVILTRTTDEFMSLPDRYTVANDNEADLFLSVHCNVYAPLPSVDGLECYYRDNAPKSREFAQNILDAAGATGEIEVRSSRVEDYRVLVHGQMPTVLVEMGFMTCPEELQKLVSDEYQTLLAETLVEAILKTLHNG